MEFDKIAVENYPSVLREEVQISLLLNFFHNFRFEARVLKLGFLDLKFI